MPKPLTNREDALEAVKALVRLDIFSWSLRFRRAHSLVWL